MRRYQVILRAGAVASAVVLAAPAALAQSAAPGAFTVNPAAVLGGATASGPFTASRASITDFSTVTYTGPSSTPGFATFLDVGFLPVTGFLSPSGVVLNDPKLNVAGGYGLYFQFSATGTQNITPTVVNGQAMYTAAYDSLSYSLYAFNQPANGTATFSVDGVTITNPGTNTTLLATGTLGSGGGGATLVNGIPVTDVFATVNVQNAAFFVSPLPFYPSVELADGNVPITPTGGGFIISGGQGIAAFPNPPTPLPEPATSSLLGAALAALGWARRWRHAPR